MWGRSIIVNGGSFIHTFLYFSWWDFKDLFSSSHNKDGWGHGYTPSLIIEAVLYTPPYILVGGILYISLAPVMTRTAGDVDIEKNA